MYFVVLLKIKVLCMQIGDYVVVDVDGDVDIDAVYWYLCRCRCGCRHDFLKAVFRISRIEVFIYPDV